MGVATTTAAGLAVEGMGAGAGVATEGAVGRGIEVCRDCFDHAHTPSTLCTAIMVSTIWTFLESQYSLCPDLRIGIMVEHHALSHTLPSPQEAVIGTGAEGVEGQAEEAVEHLVHPAQQVPRAFCAALLDEPCACSRRACRGAVTITLRWCCSAPRVHM